MWHKTGKVIAVSFVCICLFVAFKVRADEGDASKNPHEKMTAETGLITGTLLSEEKKNIPDHQVLLQVFHDKSPILTLPKQTDSKGAYQFKNIFLTNEFSYSIGTQIDGVSYSTEPVSLSKKETTKRVDLVIGANTRAAGNAMAAMPPSSEAKPVALHEGGKMKNEYKFLALLLSLGAIGYAIYLVKKKR